MVGAGVILGMGKGEKAPSCIFFLLLSGGVKTLNAENITGERMKSKVRLVQISQNAAILSADTRRNDRSFALRVRIIIGFERDNPQSFSKKEMCLRKPSVGYIDLQTAVAEMVAELGRICNSSALVKSQLQAWRVSDSLNWRKVHFSEDESLNSSSIQIL